MPVERTLNLTLATLASPARSNCRVSKNVEALVPPAPQFLSCGLFLPRPVGIAVAWGVAAAAGTTVAAVPAARGGGLSSSASCNRSRFGLLILLEKPFGRVYIRVSCWLLMLQAEMRERNKKQAVRSRTEHRTSYKHVGRVCTTSKPVALFPLSPLTELN